MFNVQWGTSTPNSRLSTVEHAIANARTGSIVNITVKHNTSAGILESCRTTQSWTERTSSHFEMEAARSTDTPNSQTEKHTQQPRTQRTQQCASTFYTETVPRRRYKEYRAAFLNYSIFSLTRASPRLLVSEERLKPFF